MARKHRTSAAPARRARNRPTPSAPSAPSVDGPLPPLLYPARNPAERRWLAGLKKARCIRAIGPRLYASVPQAKVAEAVRGSWIAIVATLYPDVLVSHRTALEFRPAAEGEIWLTSTTNRVVSYPGLRLRFVRGPGPLDDDPALSTIRSSSRARAFLENLATTRPSSRTRALPIAELEQRLEQILHVEGEQALKDLRDRARQIARKLDWPSEFRRLDGLIGAFLGTRTGQVTSAIGRARAAGEPFDAACLVRLQALFSELRGHPLPVIGDAIHTPDHVRNKAFFEAYFSNYIEGTTFEIEEAEEIIFDRKVPARRPKDAHDILGTFRLVSDPSEMRTTPRDFDQLVQLLKARHLTLMAERPEVDPGVFKDRPNRAGDTHFVDPAYVRGTLRQGMALYVDLPPGLPRAIFQLFLVSDVHPFHDGNGRIARVMMSAELVSAGQPTILIPTVYRDNYLDTLRALTRRHRPGPLVAAMLAAQRFSNLDFTSYPAILQELQRRNWFREPDEARIVL